MTTTLTGYEYQKSPAFTCFVPADADYIFELGAIATVSSAGNANFSTSDPTLGGIVNSYCYNASGSAGDKLVELFYMPIVHRFLLSGTAPTKADILHTLAELTAYNTVKIKDATALCVGPFVAGMNGSPSDGNGHVYAIIVPNFMRPVTTASAGYTGLGGS